MCIRLDKYVAFGMQKRKETFAQTMPSLSVAEGQISAVPHNEEFTYLGRRYSFEMKNESAKAALEHKLLNLLKITNNLKIRTQTKLKILSQYIHSQMIYEIKLYEFPLTWVEQTLDALCLRYMRDWLAMPISACVNEISSLPRKLTGLGIASFKQLAQKMSLSKRHALRSSKNNDVRELWALSSGQHVIVDELLVTHDSIAKATKALLLNEQQSRADRLFGLQLQGIIHQNRVRNN